MIKKIKEFLMKIKFTDFKSEFRYFKKDLYNSLSKVGNSGEYVFGNELLKFEKNIKKIFKSKICFGGWKLDRGHDNAL